MSKTKSCQEIPKKWAPSARGIAQFWHHLLTRATRVSAPKGAASYLIWLFCLGGKKKIHCVPCSSFVPSEILKDLLVGKTFLKCKSAAHQSLPIQPSSLNVNPLQDPKRLGKKHRKGLCTQKLCCANKEIQKIRHRSLIPLNLRASKGGRKVVLWKGKHCATFVQHWREMSQ